MAELRVLGMETPPKTLLFGAAAVTVVMLALLSRRSSPPAGAAGGGSVSPYPAYNPGELLQAGAEAQAELQRVGGMQALEARRIDYEYRLRAGVTPGNLRQCVPWDQWFSLPNDTRKRLVEQQTQGSLVITATAGGLCFLPTAAGVGGIPQTTVSRSRGLTRSRETVTGPAGAVSAGGGGLPSPGLENVLRQLIPVLFSNDGSPVGVPE